MGALREQGIRVAQALSSESIVRLVFSCGRLHPSALYTRASTILKPFFSLGYLSLRVMRRCSHEHHFPASCDDRARDVTLLYLQDFSCVDEATTINGSIPKHGALPNHKALISGERGGCRLSLCGEDKSSRQGLDKPTTTQGAARLRSRIPTKSASFLLQVFMIGISKGL